MARKNSVRKTAARMVMEVFYKRNAFDPQTAIPIKEFKDLRLTTPVISYTIVNFMNDKIVEKTEDDRYYFVQKEWHKMEKKVRGAYWILYGLPLISLIVVLLIMHWQDLSKIFFK